MHDVIVTSYLIIMKGSEGAKEQKTWRGVNKKERMNEQVWSNGSSRIPKNTRDGEDKLLYFYL